MIKSIHTLSLILLLNIYISCTPPRSLYRMEGSTALIKKINKLIVDSGVDLNMSIQIVSLDEDKMLYDYNSQKLLMPASTNKLYTCAASLYYLGKDHRFETQVLARKNNLILRGGADPDLKIENLDSLSIEISKKYKNIDTLFVDDSFLDSLNYGEGWMWDEGPWWYAAPISALSINDNCINFYLEPGSLGQKASVNYFPKTSYITVLNKSLTVNDTLDFKKIKIDRNWLDSKNDFIINGEIMDTAKIDTFYRNINNPTIFVGTIFRELLKKNGSKVKHLSTISKRPNDYFNLIGHQSDALLSSAKNLMNESDNLTAELFIKSIGALDTLPGTWKTGLDSVKSFLAKEVLIDTSNIRLADGSGVSRYNLTSSAQLIALLKWMYKSDYKDDFIYTLPGGGWPKSTLEKRFKTEAGLVRAKTGGLSGARNLAGYINSKKYGDVAFAILMNGYIGSSSKYTRLQNQIVKAIIYD
jgi:D-alanyl-D-alanine carboxypeptidase/D-alanyl-D-alanine-endopeptidase (penicillin-binding protein 4)